VAVVGAVAALGVTLPVIVLGGLLFLWPVEPGLLAGLLFLAALAGAIAAAAWERARQRRQPG
jgi:hypothetical protein